ncbi:WbqC family protein [bacterium]|nr:WbqC family protein [bacterium]
MTTLFSTSYFPPAIQYSEYLKADTCLIEAFEHFPKQTFRNRTYIMTANGVFMLSVPIENRRNHQFTKDIKISYAEEWQKLHWRTISNAYQRSPFYEYYDYKIEPLFSQKKHSFLLDLNLEIENTIDQILKVDINRQKTTEFYTVGTNTFRDLRAIISPKNKFLHSQILESSYLQVFADKFPFQQNLSILDVIFNLGPESITHLKQIKTTF